MAGPELLLHIGSHKTGTTTIQRALHRQPDKLAAQDVTYLTVAGVPQLHRLIGFQKRGDFKTVGFKLQRPEEITKQLPQITTGRVIASSENFSFFFQDKAVTELARFLNRHFSRVQVICYLRRQDSHAISHHQEGAKPHRIPEWALYGHGMRALPDRPEDADQYLDYNRRIGHWIDAFGAANVTVRVFDRKRLAGGDIWQDFTAAAGLDASRLDPAEQVNVSYGLAQTKLGHMMNIAEVDKATHAAVMRAVPPSDIRLLPARAEAERFYDRYRAGNIALAERLGGASGEDLFETDFSTYPEVAVEDWTEETAPIAIAGLIEALKGIAHGVDAEALRDAARLAMQANQMKLAMKLVEGAAAQRSKGPKILELRQEIKRWLKTGGKP